MHALNAWQSPNVPAHKWGGGGGPPQGEFNGIGAKLPIWFQNFRDGGHFEPSYDACLLKIASWRAPGSILEAPGLDFGASGP